MRRKSLWLAVLTLNAVWLPFISVSSIWAQNSDVKIKQIEIIGNKRIETQAVKARIKSEPGGPFRSEQVRADLKAIYELGYFEDVRIETETQPDGIVVRYILKERPLLADIQFAGNQEIKTEKLWEQVMLRTKSFLDDLAVKDSAERIRRYYEQEGYYNTVVIPAIKTLGEEQVGLIFLIKEGRKAKIRQVEITGRQGLSERKLSKAMETREYSPWTTWLTSTGYYKKEVLDLDVERVQEAYLNQGYMEVQVGAPKIEFRDQRAKVKVPSPVAPEELDTSYEFREVSALIRIPVIEGDQFRIRKIEVIGNKIFEGPELLSKLQLKEGDLFRRDTLQEGIGAMHDLYGEKGRLYAEVVPQFTPHSEDRTVDLVLQIDEDRPIQVRQIRIVGNDKTVDKVIRREIRVDEEDLINTKQLRRSFQRINNLNFFETVEITPERIGEDQVDLTVRVREKPTGALSVGGGYSSVDRVVGLLDVTQGNLFGHGWLLRARGEFGRRRTSYSLTFREPYLFDKPVSGTVSLFNIDRDFDAYKERRVGGDLTLGKSFTEYVGGSLSYTLESLKIFDVSSTAPNRVQEQEGTSVTSSLRAVLSRDTRDFFFDPREGSHASLSVEYAGTFLGGTNDFIKTILDLSRFFPLRWNTVFSIHTRLGYAAGISGDELPLGERFYVGGINTVRGFEFGRAGPVSRDDEILGADKQWIINAEYVFPLVADAGLKGLVFFDAGRGFDDDETIQFFNLRYSAGFGIRWLSPIGPLRFEWGYNLNRKRGEPSDLLEFSIGTLF